MFYMTHDLFALVVGELAPAGDFIKRSQAAAAQAAFFINHTYFNAGRFHYWPRENGFYKLYGND